MSSGPFPDQGMILLEFVQGLSLGSVFPDRLRKACATSLLVCCSGAFPEEGKNPFTPTSSSGNSEGVNMPHKPASGIKPAWSVGWGVFSISGKGFQQRGEPRKQKTTSSRLQLCLSPLTAWGHRSPRLGHGPAVKRGAWMVSSGMRWEGKSGLGCSMPSPPHQHSRDLQGWSQLQGTIC